jgi:hypothetical protein
MERKEHLHRAAGFSILGLILLVLAAALTALSGGSGSQERFEVYADPAQYTAALREAGGYLRMVLAADDLFIFAYLGSLRWASAPEIQPQPLPQALACLYWAGSTFGRI